MPLLPIPMSINRSAFIVAGLMMAASIGAIVARPTVKVSDQGPPVSLEALVPKTFGAWFDEPQTVTQVVNPQTKEMLDRLYSQILTRTYRNAEGYRIMLSLAYGTDQRERGTLQAHKPEVCYPAQGFTLRSNEPGRLSTKFGNIPVNRMFTTMGFRQEPVTYWFTVGNKAIQTKWQQRLTEIRYGLTGQIPDGLLFRISSLDSDQGRAFRMHEQFVTELLDSVPPAARLRLGGLDSVR
jgi:EpsI family protein